MMLTFIIACYRSEKTIKSVVSEIIETMALRPEVDFEIILVNDSSPDNVYKVITGMAKGNNKVKALNLSKNVGKASAVLAGISRMKGDLMVLLDDDGQCPVDHLWDLVDAIDEEHDMAVAKYPVKKQSAFKNFGSKVNHKLMCYLIGQPKEIEFSNFSVRKRFVCEKMAKYKNPFPNLQGLVLQITHKIALVPMEERERLHGKTTFTFIKSFMLLINGCTGFSVKPLRLAIFLGVIFSIFGFSLGCFIICKKIIFPEIRAGYTSLASIQLFIGGILMLLLGMIGEYIGRIYLCINHAPQYVIRDEIGFDDTNEGYR